MTAREIATLMSEILDLDEIAASDNFFEIGGNSILALTLIDEVQKRTGIKVPLLTVIRSPTPEALAFAIAGDVVPQPR